MQCAIMINEERKQAKGSKSPPEPPTQLKRNLSDDSPRKPAEQKSPQKRAKQTDSPEKALGEETQEVPQGGVSGPTVGGEFEIQRLQQGTSISANVLLYRTNR